MDEGQARRAGRAFDSRGMRIINPERIGWAKWANGFLIATRTSSATFPPPLCGSLFYRSL